MTPQNQTQNLNNYYQGGINNTNTHSNISNNNNTNNQFNFSKNNINFLNNFNIGGNTINPDNNKNNINNYNKDKREIIEDILRGTENGSFLARIENERPFTPPFTKLVPTNNLISLDKDKVNTSSISKENLLVVNPKNIIAIKNSINMNSYDNININDNKSIIDVNKSLNKNNIENNIDLSKIDEINTNTNNNYIKMTTNGNLNDSKIADRSYLIKDINYMDLVFDHVLGYYFDPKTNVYYELKANNNIINQE
jgi:hypothetical protein